MSISIEYFNDACHNVNRRTGGILMKIYKNLETGSVVEGLLMDEIPSGYRELKAGEVDAAQEKHVPQVSVEDNKLKVSKWLLWLARMMNCFSFLRNRQSVN